MNRERGGRIRPGENFTVSGAKQNDQDNRSTFSRKRHRLRSSRAKRGVGHGNDAEFCFRLGARSSQSRRLGKSRALRTCLPKRYSCVRPMGRHSLLRRPERGSAASDRNRLSRPVPTANRGDSGLTLNSQLDDHLCDKCSPATAADCARRLDQSKPIGPMIAPCAVCRIRGAAVTVSLGSPVSPASKREYGRGEADAAERNRRVTTQYNGLNSRPERGM